MQKKKAKAKKKSAARRAPANRAAKKRSQIVNDEPRPDVMPREDSPPERPGATQDKKVICFNTECRLRRAGCYGYEACPGFKVKG
jgi:hypothetical protein